jgi:hypothetical protein
MRNTRFTRIAFFGGAAALSIAASVAIKPAAPDNTNAPARDLNITLAATQVAEPKAFVATASNESEWDPEKAPLAWPRFTVLPGETPLPPMSSAAKLDLAGAIIDRWNGYKAGKISTPPTAEQSDSAARQLLSIKPDAEDRNYRVAWRLFIDLRKVDREISQDMASRASRSPSPKQKPTAAKAQGVSIGMNAAEVRESSWGRPKSINQTVTTQGTREQWVYSGGYLYFVGGVLTSIQTTR